MKLKIIKCSKERLLNVFFRTNGQASSGLILLIIKGGMDKHTSRKAVLEIISWIHAGRLGEASLIKKK